MRRMSCLWPGWITVLTTVGIHLCSSSGAVAGDRDFGSALIVGLGGAYTGANGDAGALWLNPAMVWEPERGHADLAYRQLWELRDLSEGIATVRHSFARRHSAGLGFRRFGRSPLYQETDAMASVGFRTSRRSAVGASVHYQRTEFGDNDAAYAGAFLDLGLSVTPRPDVIVGAAIRQITLDGLYDHSDWNPETLYEISAAWHAPSEITLAGIWTRERDGRNRFGIGQRLPFGHAIEFVAGLRFDPVRYSLGGVLQHAGGLLHYVYLSHPELGGTHTLGLGWGW